MRNAECFRAWSFAVTEHMQLRNVQSFDKVIRILEKFVSLATHTHNNVYADKGMRHYFLDAFNFLGKELRIVMAVHEFQNLVRTRL